MKGMRGGQEGREFALRFIAIHILASPLCCWMGSAEENSVSVGACAKTSNHNSINVVRVFGGAVGEERFRQRGEGWDERERTTTSASVLLLVSNGFPWL